MRELCEKKECTMKTCPYEGDENKYSILTILMKNSCIAKKVYPMRKKKVMLTCIFKGKIYSKNIYICIFWVCASKTYLDYNSKLKSSAQLLYTIIYITLLLLSKFHQDISYQCLLREENLKIKGKSNTEEKLCIVTQQMLILYFISELNYKRWWVYFWQK